MADHNELGRKGENEAVSYLKSEGYKIIDRNWRKHGYEIDIIALSGEYIVFVEVKTRTTYDYGNPEDFVNKQRQRRMISAANIYLNYFEIDTPPRFDIVGIVWDGFKFQIKHIEDAFLPCIN